MFLKMNMKEMKENISQGLLFLSNKNKYELREGLENICDSKKVYKIEELKEMYKRKLEEYRQVSSNYLNNLNEGRTNNFGDKVIFRKSNRAYYYVDRYGLARLIGYERPSENINPGSSGAWDSRDKESCKFSGIKMDEGDFQQLTEGITIGAGEICKTGGYNVYNENTGSVAWIDKKGIKHPYSDWDNDYKHPSCPKDKGMKLSDGKWNAYELGDEMGRESKCVMGGEIADDRLNIEMIEKELKCLEEKMKKLIEEEDKEADKYNKPINDKRKEFRDTTNNLMNTRKKYKKEMNILDSIRGNKREADLLSKGLKYEYGIYGLLSVGLLIGIVKVLK